MSGILYMVNIDWWLYMWVVYNDLLVDRLYGGCMVNDNKDKNFIEWCRLWYLVWENL